MAFIGSFGTTGFEAFIKRYKPLVHRQLSKYNWLSPEDVEDLSQETFEAYWEKYWVTKKRHRTARLLLVIARNKVYKLWNNQKPTVPFDENNEEPTHSSKSNLNHKILYGELLLLANLDEEAKLLLDLRFIHGWTFPEIAEALDINEETLKSRVKKALLQLQKVYPKGGNRQ